MRHVIDKSLFLPKAFIRCSICVIILMLMLCIFSPHISPRTDPGSAVWRRGGCYYRWILHRSAGRAAHQRPSTMPLASINDQQQHQRLLTTRPTQCLTSTHNDHEPRSPPPVITKPTLITTPANRQNPHQDAGYSGGQLHSPATNHAGTCRVSKLKDSIYYAMSYERSVYRF